MNDEGTRRPAHELIREIVQEVVSEDIDELYRRLHALESWDGESHPEPAVMEMNAGFIDEGWTEQDEAAWRKALKRPTFVPARDAELVAAKEQRWNAIQRAEKAEWDLAETKKELGKIALDRDEARKERDGMRKERDYARGCFNEQSAALERLERERDGEENLRQEAQRERDAAWNKAGKRKDQRDAWKKAAELAQRVLEAARADTQAAQRECVELKAEIRRRDGVAPETGTDRGSVPTELQPVPVDADPAPIGSWEYAMEKMRGGEKMRFRTWPEAVYVCSMGSYELRGEQYAQSGEHGLHEGWRPTMYEMDRPWWDRWTPPVDEKEDDA